VKDETAYLTGLCDLDAIVDDAIEILTAFLSATACAEIPHEKVVDAAHQVVGVTFFEKFAVTVGRYAYGQACIRPLEWAASSLPLMRKDRKPCKAMPGLLGQALAELG
jgi:hypothetical protein